MAGKGNGTIWRVDVDRLIYTTITLMSVLIIYDGWGRLSVEEVRAVKGQRSPDVLGPPEVQFTRPDGSPIADRGPPLGG